MDLTPLTQSPWLYVVIGAAVVIVAVIVVAAVAATRRRRERAALRSRYGPEYDHTLTQHRSTRAAVADLKEREQLHDALELRDLNDADRDLVRRHMAALQFRFVDDPADVLLQTDRVVTEVLRARGYPVAEDRDKAVRLFSVDHPDHAAAIRTAMAGNHGDDLDRMRATFLDVRRALAEVAGISYALDDVTDERDTDDAPRDLRVESDIDAPTHVAPTGPPATP
jgi:hypothetical protein